MRLFYLGRSDGGATKNRSDKNKHSLFYNVFFYSINNLPAVYIVPACTNQNHCQIRRSLRDEASDTSETAWGSNVSYLLPL